MTVYDDNKSNNANIHRVNRTAEQNTKEKMIVVAARYNKKDDHPGRKAKKWRCVHSFSPFHTTRIKSAAAAIVALHCPKYDNDNNKGASRTRWCV